VPSPCDRSPRASVPKSHDRYKVFAIIHENIPEYITGSDKVVLRGCIKTSDRSTSRGALRYLIGPRCFSFWSINAVLRLAERASTTRARGVRTTSAQVGRHVDAKAVGARADADKASTPYPFSDPPPFSNRFASRIFSYTLYL
jgi:hypothetical protein